MLFVGCLTSQQQATVSQGRICTDNFTCCHTEIEVADQTFYLTQSQYTDTGPTSPSADPTTPGAWQGSHWSANFEVTGMTRPRKNPVASGIRTRDLPLSRRTPYHKANEAVYSGERHSLYHFTNQAVPCYCLFAGCLTSQQHVSVPQGRICSEKFACCHTEIEVTEQSFLSHQVTVY